MQRLSLEERKVNEVEISNDDFTLVQSNVRITDTKLSTKPTTFLKDALKRFRKNKSSVVGAFILGLLILLAIIVPVVSPHDIDKVVVQQKFLAPKLFEAGTGFWDGTREYERIIYDEINEAPADYNKNAVVSINVDENYSEIDVVSRYGKGGYVIFATDKKVEGQVFTLKSELANYKSTGDYKVTFKLLNKDNIQDSKLTDYRVYLSTDLKNADGSITTTEVLLLQDWSNKYEEITIDISEALKNANMTHTQAKLTFEIKSDSNSLNYIAIESCVFTTTDTVNKENYEHLVNEMSFTDANKMVMTTVDMPGYWVCDGRKGIHANKVKYCDFVFDTYEEAFGLRELTFATSQIEDFVKNGWLEFEYKIDPKTREVEIIKFNVLDKEKCPLEVLYEDQFKVSSRRPYKLLEIKGAGYKYKELGYEKMPVFIFGTDVSGHDIFKKAFAGLRTSLILGVCTAAFCFLFGLCWGSISGYFGGNVDLFMERFCDILSGVPSTVTLTLAILHLGNNFITFFLALCMTGWMGTAGRTRTQFYRFKGREYVLASRTLGASDGRLIFKHILPNALGTIITSSVLMIPSVIFSEATLAYLNLGLQGVHSFGVMMSNNQQYLQPYPNLVIFPAVIIALMMISFNLFGNGLRDALNPSLKGSE